MSIPIENISFVKIYFAQIYKDSCFSHPKTIMEKYFLDEQSYNQFIKQVEYPLCFENKGYKLAIKIGDTYHPLCAPIVFRDQSAMVV